MLDKIVDKVEKAIDKVFTKDSCSVLGKEYPHGGVACIGDQCIQCDDGKWGPNKFEEDFRKRNLDL